MWRGLVRMNEGIVGSVMSPAWLIGNERLRDVRMSSQLLGQRVSDSNAGVAGTSEWDLCKCADNGHASSCGTCEHSSGFQNFVNASLTSEKNIGESDDLVLLCHDVLRFFRQEIFGQKIYQGCVDKETRGTRKNHQYHRIGMASNDAHNALNAPTRINAKALDGSYELRVSKPMA